MEFDWRGEEDDDNEEDSYANSSEAPSIVDDEELIMREKNEALIMLHDAVWTVSSAKHGNGVTCLLDDCHETFWQSDGVLPHVISIDFARLTSVATVALFLSSQQDESYTPRKIRVQAGTHSGDMADVAVATVDNPQGWVLMRVAAEAEPAAQWELGEAGVVGGRTAAALPTSATTGTRGRTSFPTSSLDLVGNDDHAEFLGEGVWCTHLRIIIKENRQNGRDCHVRGVRVLGPVHQSVFTTSSFTQNLLLR
ncbi:anaphase promoting complex subunit 10 [Trypanosoma grayi]|uniref:anaphase promoting complex subunit 10 n=1 Tax=Trypanosoma grayi TaxID=71804 RepID=UPI0004F3F189|nr:anaphase promoting complex subunit 10 [Trypanosoma grayi]KEG14053.1 anaphase promoting complex subunit 10 [Trypanosoma grayi]